MSLSTLAEPASPARATDAGAAASSAARLHHLFRTSLRNDRVHPLLRVVQLYRSKVPATGGPYAVPRSAAHAQRPKTLDAEQVRRRVSELPHLPQAALRALQTLRRDDSSLDEVANDLGCDASLTARVLRLANSPFYGVPGRVSTARDAAQVLGRRTLESMLTLAAVAGQFAGQRSKVFDTAAFWRHALASALVARSLAREAKLDEDQAFAAALLHDIGLLAMGANFPDELDALMAAAQADDCDFGTVEQQHALTPHALVGSWIAAHWNFPPVVVHAIAAHHVPARGADDASAAMAACVHVANAIAHALDVAELDNELVPAVDPEAWRKVAPADDALCRLLEETETGVRALCAALAL